MFVVSVLFVVGIRHYSSIFGNGRPKPRRAPSRLSRITIVVSNNWALQPYIGFQATSRHREVARDGHF
jgi:hypothetical protein